MPSAALSITLGSDELASNFKVPIIATRLFTASNDAVSTPPTTTTTEDDSPRKRKERDEDGSSPNPITVKGRSAVQNKLPRKQGTLLKGSNDRALTMSASTL
jgi:hypothetical protein